MGHFGTTYVSTVTRKPEFGQLFSDVFRHVSAKVLKQQSHTMIHRDKKSLNAHTLAPVKEPQCTDGNSKPRADSWHKHKVLPFKLDWETRHTNCKNVKKPRVYVTPRQGFCFDRLREWYCWKPLVRFQCSYQACRTEVRTWIRYKYEGGCHK